MKNAGLKPTGKIGLKRAKEVGGQRRRPPAKIGTSGAHKRTASPGKRGAKRSGVRAVRTVGRSAGRTRSRFAGRSANRTAIRSGRNSTRPAEFRNRRSSPALPAQLWRAGRHDGKAWRAEHPSGNADEMRAYMRRQWQQRTRQQPGLAVRDAKTAWTRARAYAEGFGAGAGLVSACVPIPLNGSAAAVVYAEENGDALASVLKQLDRLPLDEIVIVLGNASEPLLQTARSHSRATVVHLPEDVHPDIGRALGAKLAGADIVLAVDGLQPVSADKLARLLWAADGRLDVALNDRSPFLGTFRRRNELDRFHEFLNTTLNRPDLRMNTLASLPFALSRRALKTIGAAELSVPAKAHAKALLKGLAVGTAVSVHWRPALAAKGLPGREEIRLAAGDLAEAWQEAMSLRGARLHFPDGIRNRNAAGGTA